MPDVSWGELMVIGIVALIVIGPKDLPRVMRTCGKWMRKMRAMASEFQGQMATIDREMEMEELREQIRQMRDPELEKQVQDMMARDPVARPRAPVNAEDWAGSGAGVSEDELLSADMDELAALDRAGLGGRRGATATTSATADAADDAAIRHFGADDFLSSDLAEATTEAAEHAREVAAREDPAHEAAAAAGARGGGKA